LWYALSQVAYVGGSLNEPGGGHNILEPVALGVATVLGKNYFNFQQIVDEFANNAAVDVVQDAQQACQRFTELLNNVEQRQQMVQRATTILQKNQGSLLRHIQLIDRFLQHS
jgi:3-deoxy-D-manno-octulosonic-acid transferase